MEKNGNTPQQHGLDSMSEAVIESRLDYDPMSELEQLRLEAVYAHNEMRDLEQKLRHIQNRYDQVVTSIPDGSTITVQPKAGSEIRVFSVENDRQTGFVDLGDNFVGKKLKDEIYIQTTELVGQNGYVRLDNTQALKTWIVTRIEKPQAS